MKKLEKLKIERRIAEALTFLPKQVVKIISNFYKREIDEIEQYGAANPDVRNESISELKDFLKGQKDGN